MAVLKSMGCHNQFMAHAYAIARDSAHNLSPEAHDRRAD
jgi:hypothetical protein